MSIKISSVLALCSSMAIAAPAIWNGTADVSWYTSSAQAYNLTTAEQLAGLAKLVNQGTSSFEGKTITLGADIFLNDTTGAGAGTWASTPHTEWVPIGTSSRPFKGEFDGIAGKKNRKIYGLYVSDATKDYVGLFGYTSNVKISNLDVLVGRITAKDNVGALVGYAVGGSLTNVHSEVKVTGNNHVGGLVGYFTGTLSTSSVKENVVGQDSVGGLVGITTGSVSGTDKSNSYFTGNVSGRKYVGGLVGAGSSISKSYAEGIVKGDSSYVGGVAGSATGSVGSTYHIGGDVSGVGYVGGLIGQASSAVTNSYSEGNVTGTSSYVGGLVGYGSSVASSRHTKGDVNGTNRVGGLIGQTSSAVTNSYSEGNVTGQGNYVGGLIGLSYYSYSGSSDATIMTAQNSYAIGNVKGKGYVGGLIGLDSIYRSSKNTKTLVKKVSNSHSVGNVNGKDKYVGGVLGKSNYGYYSSSYNTNISLQILSSYHNGSVEGDSSYVGGIAGQVNGILDSTHHIDGNVNGYGYVGGLVGHVTSSVKNSYSEGNVTGIGSYIGGLVGYGVSVDSSNHTKGDVNGAGYVGGLIGQVSSSVTNSYSEGNVTGLGNYVGGLIGLSYYYYSDSSNITIMTAQNSHATGNVKGKGYVGGLIGLDSIYRSSNNTKTLIKKISSSHSVGNVVGNDKYVGGVLGKSNYGYYSSSYSSNISLQMLSSYHKGSVESASDYVGGVAGYASGSISSSYHIDGDVSGTGYVGGLIGRASSTVSNSYSEGNVLGTLDYVGGLVGYGVSVASSNHIKGDVNGQNYVGGLAGRVSTSVTNSYSEGNVTGTGNYVGGLIGLSYYYYSSDSPAITIMTAQNSYATGNVSGKGYVGGLIGLDSIYNGGSYWSILIKKISNSHSVGNVIGNGKYVGGVIGKSDYGYSSAYSPSISLQILSSYHRGSVESASDYVGGVAGYAGGIIDSTYHVDGNVIGYGYVGGLAGRVSSTVTNSSSEGDVSGQGNFVGGLIGLSYYDYSGSSDTTITTAQNSYAIGNVKGNGSVGGLIGLDSIRRSSYSTKTLVKKISESHSVGNVIGNGQYVGGILGKSNYGYYSSSYSSNISLQIHSSYHKGSVEGKSSYVGGVAGYACGNIDSTYHNDGDVSGVGYVGGLSGLVESISNSHSEGNVVGSLDYVGGIAGSSGKIRNSYAEAKYVRGRNIVGGLAGYAEDSIDVSYFEGDSVSGINQIGGLVGRANKAVDSSYSTANVKGDDEVGGLVGSAYGDVSNSYAIGNVVGDVDHSSAGNDNLGGLVGYQYSGSISKSMALGNVSGTTKLGGLVGRFDGTKISQSYANGNVTGDYYGDPADEVGNYYIGGLVGYAKGALEETYASGVVIGIEDEPVYTGCVVGYVNGSLSVTKSYYDKTKCGLGIDGGENAASVSGTPDKTTAEMQTQSTFEDWDFTDTWKIMENTYPFLQIYSNSLTNAVVTTQFLEGINYDGTAKTPLVTSVTLFGETLEYETEYTIAYANNVNAGTASINVCGVKPYGGCKVVEFEIAGIAIKPTIAAIDDMTYTGRALTPEIKVYNGETLLAVTDYTAEYKDNVNAGTAVVTVTMKGNYSGSASKTFTIEKAVPVINQNPTASDVVLGQTLAASEFSGGRANVDGEFVWNTPTTKPALENEGYAVVFVPTDTNYTKSAEIIVPVKVLDLVYVAVHVGGNTLDSTTLVKGASYTLPSAPDSTGYDFYAFYNGKILVGLPGNQVSISENTVIDAVYKVQTFKITFKNGSTVLQSSEVAYGTVPTAPTVTLPKNTAQYTYSFAGWDKDVAAVTEAATYTAVIDSVVNKYEVVFKDYDGTELKDSVYEYGTTAAKIVKPADPKREASARYTYTFKGWNPTISDVIGDKVYTATFDSTINTYLIAFVNKYDTLQSVKTEMEYGAIPAYKGTPTRKSTAQYVYTFKEWTPEVVAVSEAATYTAVFDSSVQSYTITFVNGSEELQSDKIAYGVLPEYAGATPTKKATVQYTYTFKGWTPTIAKVTGTATYKAVFDSVINKYLVTFKNGSKVIQRDSIAYGTLPTVPSITLPKNTTQYTYSMSWDKTVVKVTGDAVYTATIDSTVNKYEVSFRNYDGTLIKKSTYAYGSTVAKPSDPTRASTAKFTFTFKGWTPIVASVTANAVYKAVFDSTVRTYTVTFMNGDKKLQTSNLAYGSMPKYTGVTPTKASTKNYSYEFIGWSPKIGYVVGAATYKAVFDSIKTTGMMNSHLASLEMSVNVISRDIQISAAPVGSTYAIFDMQGRVLKMGRVETPNFNILMPQAGMYFVRVGNYDQRISIK